MKRFFALSLHALAVLFAMTMSAAAVTEMSPNDAHRAMQAGELVMVDVREPTEWRQTGIIPGAATIAMRDPRFLDKLQTVIDAHPGKTIGLICAAGGRSTAIANALEQRGMTNVVDVDAGMLGRFTQKGWIASGLPVEPWTGD